ncbi:signal peptide peptidase SppA [Planctomicrobium sp. SH664]|uniref:signal peptide peptidase SppA n=1 Tax=Planctomicrobium sp. SH664 TaxID=3448125 RepID=UPI003F5B2294
MCSHHGLENVWARRTGRVCSLVTAIALAWLIFGSAATARAADEKPTTPGTVAVFEFNSPITDQPKSDDGLFGTATGESLRALISRLDKAGKDDNVAAVVLLLDSPSMSTFQSEELQQCIKRLKDKKPVYAHADSLTTGSYLMVVNASRISLSPVGDAWVNGIYGEQMFVRGLLDMLGVQPDFLTCGSYKSAAEMFMRKGPSPESAEMYKWLFDSMYSSIQKMIASGRGVDEEQVRKWIDQGMFSARSAQEARLTDAVETREQLWAFVKETHGATVKLDRRYGKKAGPHLDVDNPFAALQLWAQLISGPKPTKPTRNAVAIVHVDGPIMLGKPAVSAFGTAEGAFSEEIRKALGKVADEPRIRAVVLRVNSPGGSATASEIILRAVENVQSKKPVIVSMGGLAASGGYYVSCRGERIFADETTITGSIGVVAGKLATRQMWERIGITFDPIQRGARAGLLKSSLPFTAGDKEELQKWMDDVYSVFKQHVEEGRKDKLTKPIDEIAGGRVYTGEQALALGLIDQIGTLDDAIAYAAEKAELKQDYDVRTFPEETTFLEKLFADVATKKDLDDRRLSTDMWSAIEPMLKGLDPQRVKSVKAALQQLDLLQQENVILTMPVISIHDR